MEIQSEQKYQIINNINSSSLKESSISDSQLKYGVSFLENQTSSSFINQQSQSLIDMNNDQNALYIALIGEKRLTNLFLKQFLNIYYISEDKFKFFKVVKINGKYTRTLVIFDNPTEKFWDYYESRQPTPIYLFEQNNEESFNLVVENFYKIQQYQAEYQRQIKVFVESCLNPSKIFYSERLRKHILNKIPQSEKEIIVHEQNIYNTDEGMQELLLKIFEPIMKKKVSVVETLIDIHSIDNINCFTNWNLCKINTLLNCFFFSFSNDFIVEILQKKELNEKVRCLQIKKKNKECKEQFKKLYLTRQNIQCYVIIFIVVLSLIFPFVSALQNYFKFGNLFKFIFYQNSLEDVEIYFQNSPLALQVGKEIKLQLDRQTFTFFDLALYTISDCINMMFFGPSHNKFKICLLITLFTKSLVTLFYLLFWGIPWESYPAHSNYMNFSYYLLRTIYSPSFIRVMFSLSLKFQAFIQIYTDIFNKEEDIREIYIPIVGIFYHYFDSYRRTEIFTRKEKFLQFFLLFPNIYLSIMIILMIGPIFAGLLSSIPFIISVITIIWVLSTLLGYVFWKLIKLCKNIRCLPCCKWLNRKIFEELTNEYYFNKGNQGQITINIPKNFESPDHFDSVRAYRFVMISMSLMGVFLNILAVYGNILMNGCNFFGIFQYQYSGIEWFNFNIYSYNYFDILHEDVQMIANWLNII